MTLLPTIPHCIDSHTTVVTSRYAAVATELHAEVRYAEAGFDAAPLLMFRPLAFTPPLPTPLSAAADCRLRIRVTLASVTNVTLLPPLRQHQRHAIV